MRNLASTMFAVFALAICLPGIALALPLAASIDRAIAAAPVNGQTLAIQYQPRNDRADASRRTVNNKARRSQRTGHTFYAVDPASSYPAYYANGYYGNGYYGNGYPFYYPGYGGYPHYYAGYYWPHYYGRYRYPGYDYSPFAFFGYRPSDFY